MHKKLRQNEIDEIQKSSLPYYKMVDWEEKGQDIFFNAKEKRLVFFTDIIQALIQNPKIPHHFFDESEGMLKQMLIEKKYIKKLHQIVYRPDRKEKIFVDYTFEENGEIVFNLFDHQYFAISEPISADGKAFINDFFIKTMEYMYHENGAKILLNWLAFIMQNPGKPLFWAPFIVQKPINRKPFIQYVLETCIGNMVNTITPWYLATNVKEAMCSGVVGVFVDYHPQTKKKEINRLLNNEFLTFNSFNKTSNIRNTRNNIFISNDWDYVQIPKNNRFVVIKTNQQPNHSSKLPKESYKNLFQFRKQITQYLKTFKIDSNIVLLNAI